VRGKVRRELQRLGAVGAELYGRDGDAVRARVAVGFEDPAPVHDRRVPLSLFGVYGYVSERLDGCDRAGLGFGFGFGFGLGAGCGSGKDVGKNGER